MRSSRMILFNQKGLSLVELLMATGVGAIILFTIFTIHTYMMRSQTTAMNNMDVVELKYEVASLMSKETNCTSILAGKTSTAGTAITVSPTIYSGANWAGGRLRITDVRLQGIQSQGSNKVSAKLQLKGTRAGLNLARADFDEYINIYYSVSGSTITTCKDDTAVCNNMGGVWRGDHCDFCANLGGAVRADGTCAPTL